MKSLLIPVVAACLALSGGALAQEAQNAPPASPPTPEQQQEQAQMKAINAYVQILFAQEVEKRCEHLGDEKKAEFTDDVATVDGYMKENLSDEVVTAVEEKATTAGADEENNPCGKDSKQFVEQSADMTAQISDSIEQSKQQSSQPGE
ncbi:MAG: hypothetical protein ACLFWF_04025 [Alphaproteobacteria bacterium]